MPFWRKESDCQIRNKIARDIAARIDDDQLTNKKLEKLVSKHLQHPENEHAKIEVAVLVPILLPPDKPKGHCKKLVSRCETKLIGLGGGVTKIHAEGSWFDENKEYVEDSMRALTTFVSMKDWTHIPSVLEEIVLDIQGNGKQRCVFVIIDRFRFAEPINLVGRLAKAYPPQDEFQGTDPAFDVDRNDSYDPEPQPSIFTVNIDGDAQFGDRTQFRDVYGDVVINPSPDEKSSEDGKKKKGEELDRVESRKVLHHVECQSSYLKAMGVCNANVPKTISEIQHPKLRLVNSVFSKSNERICILVHGESGVGKSAQIGRIFEEEGTHESWYCMGEDLELVQALPSVQLNAHPIIIDDFLIGYDRENQLKHLESLLQRRAAPVILITHHDQVGKDVRKILPPQVWRFKTCELDIRQHPGETEKLAEDIVNNSNISVDRKAMAAINERLKRHELTLREVENRIQDSTVDVGVVEGWKDDSDLFANVFENHDKDTVWKILSLHRVCWRSLTEITTLKGIPKLVFRKLLNEFGLNGNPSDYGFNSEYYFGLNQYFIVGGSSDIWREASHGVLTKHDFDSSIEELVGENIPDGPEAIDSIVEEINRNIDEFRESEKLRNDQPTAAFNLLLSFEPENEEKFTCLSPSNLDEIISHVKSFRDVKELTSKNGTRAHIWITRMQLRTKQKILTVVQHLNSHYAIRFNLSATDWAPDWLRLNGNHPFAKHLIKFGKMYGDIESELLGLILKDWFYSAEGGAVDPNQVLRDLRKLREPVESLSELAEAQLSVILDLALGNVLGDAEGVRETADERIHLYQNALTKINENEDWPMASSVAHHNTGAALHHRGAPLSEVLEHMRKSAEVERDQGYIAGEHFSHQLMLRLALMLEEHERDWNQVTEISELDVDFHAHYELSLRYPLIKLSSYSAFAGKHTEFVVDKLHSVWVDVDHQKSKGLYSVTGGKLSAAMEFFSSTIHSLAKTKEPKDFPNPFPLTTAEEIDKEWMKIAYLIRDHYYVTLGWYGDSTFGELEEKIALMLFRFADSLPINHHYRYSRDSRRDSRAISWCLGEWIWHLFWLEAPIWNTRKSETLEQNIQVKLYFLLRTINADVCKFIDYQGEIDLDATVKWGIDKIKTKYRGSRKFQEILMELERIPNETQEKNRQIILENRFNIPITLQDIIDERNSLLDRIEDVKADKNQQDSELQEALTKLVDALSPQGSPLNEYTVKQLKHRLRILKQKVSGRKAELVERLEGALDTLTDAQIDALDDPDAELIREAIRRVGAQDVVANY